METPSTQLDLFYRFGSALALGLLVGLQREYAWRSKGEKHPAEFAGARTFSLLALLGCTAALVSDLSGSAWLTAAVALALGAVIAVAYARSSATGELGITSEVAALTTFLAGALCYLDRIVLAAALAVSMTVLLALKLQTAELARRLTAEDVRATLTFAVLTLVVLPVLPHHPIGPPPFDVLVPYKVWLMVVFISGIGFTGYVTIKLVGPRRGVVLTGLLGGLASSTAVTLSFSQRSRGAPGLARPFALAILLSWTVMFARVLVEVAAINAALLPRVAVPLLAAGLAGLAYCTWLMRSGRGSSQAGEDDFTNPFDLMPALTFGLVYVVVLLVANAASTAFGESGIYAASIASGLADVDAITLSVAELSRGDGGLAPPTAARAIVLAVAANTLVKGAIVLAAGAAALRRAILPGLLVTLATAVAVVFLT